MSICIEDLAWLQENFIYPKQCSYLPVLVSNFNLDNYRNATMQDTVLHTAAPSITRENPTESRLWKVKPVVPTSSTCNCHIRCELSTYLAIFVGDRTEFLCKLLSKSHTISRNISIQAKRRHLRADLPSLRQRSNQCRKSRNIYSTSLLAKV